MKLFLLSLFLPIFCLAQSPETKTTGRTLPQEMVFVHMDNTCYFLGDTLYYKAYVQRSDTGKPTNLSEVLYVELLNQDGYLVERQVLRMKGGQANSCFCLEDTLYAGFYELRAYTRWQLNFGRTEHPHDRGINRWFLKKEYAAEYFTDYDKLYSRVFPVYDKPQAAGEYYRDMTLRPLRRDYAPENPSPTPTVTLFPEGGNLVSGIRQRVAFEAQDGAGQHVGGKLFALGDAGDTLFSALTENRGRGCLELELPQNSPAKWQLYFLPASGGGTGEAVKVSSPKVHTTGAVMKVEQDAASIVADISLQGVEQNGIRLQVTSCGRPGMQVPFEGGPLTISKDDLPAGVAQLTLLQNETVLADRLVFVHKPEQQGAPLQILNAKEKYAPLEKVSLTVKSATRQGAAEGVGLSLSVRDNVSSDLICDNGNIMTEMLLSSHIKGFVENPGYYFEADDAEHRRHLDLLLMVQGWRRFDSKPTEIVEPYEKSQMIVGEVCKYTPLVQEDDACYDTILDMKKKDQEKIDIERLTTSAPSSRREGTFDLEFLNTPNTKTHLHAEFAQPGFPVVYGDMTVKEDGKFSFQAPHFGGYCVLHLAAATPEKLEKADVKDEKNKQKQQKKGNGKAREVSHQWILPNADEYADFSIRVRRCYPRFVKPYEYYRQQVLQREDENGLQQDENGLRMEGLNDVTALQEVQVRRKRRIYRGVDLTKPAVVMDAYDAFNQVVDAGLTCAFYAGAESFRNIFSRMLVGDMGLQRGEIPIEKRWDGRTKNVHSIQVVEEMIKYNHLEHLDKVYAYTDYAPRKEGSKQYAGSDRPEVIIDLHRYLDESVRPAYRDRFIVLDGYSASAEFYHPDYSKHKLPEGQNDYRRTLYWNPDLLLDANGEAEVTFYNNSRTTTLSVEAEGQAADGTLLWGQW